MESDEEVGPKELRTTMKHSRVISPELILHVRSWQRRQSQKKDMFHALAKVIAASVILVASGGNLRKRHVSALGKGHGG